MFIFDPKVTGSNMNVHRVRKRLCPDKGTCPGKETFQSNSDLIDKLFLTLQYHTIPTRPLLSLSLLPLHLAPGHQSLLEGRQEASMASAAASGLLSILRAPIIRLNRVHERLKRQVEFIVIFGGALDVRALPVLFDQVDDVLAASLVGGELPRVRPVECGGDGGQEAGMLGLRVPGEHLVQVGHEVDLVTDYHQSDL